MASAIGKEYKFSEGFTWSCATAAAQIEGGWNEDGRGPSIWDTFSHTSHHIKDKSTPEVACHSYHQFDTDLALLKHLGVQQYRLSISWSRVLPKGTVDSVSQKGVEYYRSVFEKLTAANIEPAVTLYHWDLPDALQCRGGWLNRQCVTWFEEYARLCFKTFGDKVKLWITLNEPWVQSWWGYCGDGGGFSTHAPGGFPNHSRWSAYMCGHHLLLAHAHAYRAYEREFKSEQKGKCGITLVTGWFEPASEREADKLAAERGMQTELGWFAHPIYSKTGDYPLVLKERIDLLSNQEGLACSRLPEFTPAEITLLRGSSDFFGLNYYVAHMCEDRPPDKYPADLCRRFRDGGFIEYNKPEWKPLVPGNWCHNTPWGLHKVLKWIKHNYDNPPVLITENGCPNSPGDSTQDHARIEYVGDHLRAVWNAIHQDGCHVTGYTLWSLMDNFEWSEGYTLRFGIYEVDFQDPNRKRTAKLSADWYRKCIAANAVVPSPGEVEPVSKV